MKKYKGQSVAANRDTTITFRQSFAVLVLTAVTALLGSNARADNVGGAWSTLENWPLIAIHAALTPDGRVLSYGTDGTGKQTGYFIYDVWDPSAGLTGGHMTLNNMTLTDIFCSSQIILPQTGNILIAGGDNWTGTGTTNTGNANSNIFDYGDNTLARSANMNRARWYSSATALPNGEIYIQGGTGGADLPEVRELDGDFRLLTAVNTGSYATLFPRNFLAPDGRVFGYDTSGKMYFVDPDRQGALTTAGNFSSSYVGWTSGAAMFAPGKILQMGGNSNGAIVIDITGSEPTTTPTQSMSTKRQWVSATVLADGKVLATGGSERDNQMIGVNNSAEIWDPATGVWQEGASGAVARLYHSSALLLPDASVLIAGGGAPGPLVNTNAEIYYPPYLYDSNGNFAARPQINSAPDTANPGDRLDLEVDSTVDRVTLVKFGSVTHSVNMDQRFLELDFATSGTALQASLPLNAFDTPPGYYMLFVIDDAGVPSEASILRINLATGPGAEEDYTPLIGGRGGSAFELACAADEVLVGIRARYDTYINQISPTCVRVDQNGQWIGDPTYGGVTGNTASGSVAIKTCPRDMAVSGIRGWTEQYVDRLELECRSLTPSGGLTGSPQYLGADGGPGGIDQGVLSCGSGNPAYALYGGSGGWIDSIGLKCRPAEITHVGPSPLTVDPMPPQPAVLVGDSTTYTAVSQGGSNVVYRWNFGDGTPETAYSSSSSISHTFNDPGVHFVTLTVNDDAGVPSIQTFSQRTHLALTSNKPQNSSTIAYEERTASDSRVWVVNPDNESVTVINAVSDAKVAEVSVGVKPRSVAIAPDGRVWITNKGSATISIIDPGSLSVVDTVNMPHASSPHGIVFSPASGEAYVALEATGELQKLDSSTGGLLASVDVGLNVRHLAVDASGTQVYVSRFVSPPQPGEETGTVLSEVGGIKYGGEVLVIDTAAMALVKTIVLQHSDLPDGEIQGRGVPNYLGAAAISPDGTTASLPSKLDNIARGSLRDGLNLNFQNTVRAVASSLDLAVDEEVYTQRVDLDNASVASAAAHDHLGLHLFVALETSGEVAVVDVHNNFEMFRFNTGLAPQGLAVSPDGLKLFVHNFMDRNVTVHDLTELQEEGQWDAPILATVNTVGTEMLSANVLLGKQFFYQANDTRLALDNYLSCATCHNDGGQDGRVWDLTGMGEGLRNTINLDGSGAAHGPLHWSANFDEVHDFEGQIRDLSGGTGLMTDADFNFGTRSASLGDPKAGVSADLDALAAYVESLTTYPDSPFRNSDGSLSGNAADGREVFRRENCAQCHSGTAFTDSAPGNLHDIGTLKGSSGTRLYGALTGIDTPTLRGLWGTAPYLHDGSAPTLAAAIAAHNGVSLNAADEADLVDYLMQIDANEVEAPEPNVPPSVTNPGSQANVTGNTISLQIVASDADGDPLQFSAFDLPLGLSINSVTGEIGGLLTTAGSHNVMVTVDDGIDAVSINFDWQVTGPTIPPNTPPTISNPGSQSGLTGDAVSLLISANDDDGDTLDFSATGLPGGLSINSATGEIDGTLSTAGSFNVTVTVSDGADSASTSFSWTVTQPNTPPTIDQPAAQSTPVGSAANLAISASDADNDVLSYSASGLPVGLSIASGTGIISGVATVEGSYSVTVTVSDGEDSANTTFSWEVTSATSVFTTQTGNSESVTLDCTGDPCPWGQSVTGEAIVWENWTQPVSNRLGYTATMPIYLPADYANGATVRIVSGTAFVQAGDPDDPSSRTLATLDAGEFLTVSGLAAGEVMIVRGDSAFTYEVDLPTTPGAEDPTPEQQSVLVTLQCTGTDCPWGQSVSAEAVIWPASAAPVVNRRGYTASDAAYLPAASANGTLVSIVTGTAGLYAGAPDDTSHRLLATVEAGGFYDVTGLAAGEVLSVQGQGGSFSYKVVLP